MARTSKLTDNQWKTIKRKLDAGEATASELAAKYGIDKSAITRRITQPPKAIKAAANKMLEAEKLLEKIPITQHAQVYSLVADLRAISNHLTQAACNGAKTASHLSAIAHQQLAKINPDNPMESQEELQAVSALTKIANDSASLGMGLLNANKQNQEQDKTITVVRSNVTKRLTQ